jgi:uncharacterized membrane protein
MLLILKRRIGTIGPQTTDQMPKRIVAVSRVVTAMNVLLVGPSVFFRLLDGLWSFRYFQQHGEAVFTYDLAQQWRLDLHGFSAFTFVLLFGIQAELGTFAATQIDESGTDSKRRVSARSQIPRRRRSMHAVAGIFVLAAAVAVTLVCLFTALARPAGESDFTVAIQVISGISVLFELWRGFAAARRGAVAVHAEHLAVSYIFLSEGAANVRFWGGILPILDRHLVQGDGYMLKLHSPSEFISLAECFASHIYPHRECDPAQNLVFFCMRLSALLLALWMLCNSRDAMRRHFLRLCGYLAVHTMLLFAFRPNLALRVPR